LQIKIFNYGLGATPGLKRRRDRIIGETRRRGSPRGGSTSRGHACGGPTSETMNKTTDT